MNYELGRLPSKQDSRTLRLANYLAELPKPPEAVNWYKALPAGGWGVMGNDRLGNCVVCTAAHIIDAAEANESYDPKPIPDETVIKLSYAMEATNGFTILERLKYWRNHGMFDSRIEAFVQASTHNSDLLKNIIHIFGHADIGVWMPRAWRAHPHFWDTGKGWEYRLGGWGGHSVCLVGYEPDQTHGTLYKAISWGVLTDVTQAALDEYTDEIWVSLLPDWYMLDGIAPSGFDLVKLREDLALVS